jgi:hypothetical protein
MSTIKPCTSILAIRPSVSRQEALRAFRASGLSAVYWRAVRGPLQRIAASYVPFRLYHVEYEIGAARHSRCFALDRVQGMLDLFEFPSEPSSERLTEIDTRNHLPVLLDHAQSESLLREKVLRIIFQQGFFRIREVRLDIQPSSLSFHMPYWLGFYGVDGRLRCRVMDAVRRRMEGTKASQLFENWLEAA